MEQTTGPTLSALAALIALPIVAFALWADYFERHLKFMVDEKIELEKEHEVQRVHIGALMVAVFQLLVFLNAGEARKAHPIAAHALFIVALVVQGWLQAQVERKAHILLGAKLATEHPVAVFKSGMRNLLWISIAFTSYMVVATGTIFAFSAAGLLFKASPEALSALSLVGAIVGMAGGTVVLFALAPIQLRNLLPCLPLEGAKAEQIIETFKQAGMNVPRLWILEPGRFPGATALVVGFRNGRGPLTPALFISRALVEKLDSSEFEAVIAHEISHLRLNHLRKRAVTTAAISFGMVVALAFAWVMLPILVPSMGAAIRELVAPMGGFIGMLLSLRLIGQQSRTQELEADFEAVYRHNASAQALVSALKKIDLMNGHPHDRAGWLHPSTEERVAILEAVFSEKGEEDISSAA